MSRRQARERALQILFQVDMGGADPKDAFKSMEEDFGISIEGRDFAQRLVCGTVENLKQIDRIIASISKEWQLKRMASVDRNIIRMALYEVLYCDDIPNNVSVNEAIELGKVFGGEDSWRFISGILGKVLESPDEFNPERSPDIT